MLTMEYAVHVDSLVIQIEHFWINACEILTLEPEKIAFFFISRESNRN